MEEQQEQRDIQLQHHTCRVVDGIARTYSDPGHGQERHKLTVRCGYVDRHSLQHLVEFFDNSCGRDGKSSDNNGSSHNQVVITEMELVRIRLNEPSDGGLNVLTDIFARRDMTGMKVTIENCHFGTAQDASQLLAAFESNRAVTDLTIRRIHNLDGVALGACLSSLMQNMPQLQRLECSQSGLHVEGLRALQPALQANRMLRELGLRSCAIGKGGICLIVDALVGNTIIEILDIGGNYLVFNDLDEITRLIESTRLQKLDLSWNGMAFCNEAATQRFAHALSRHNFLKELNLCGCRLRDDSVRVIAAALVGNTIMEALNISQNLITANGLADIMWLLESTRLKTISFSGNRKVFENDEATQHFVTALQHKQSRIQDLPRITDHVGASYASIITNSLKRNEQLNHVDLLLAPPRQQQQQQQQARNAGTIMLKISHKAITKFARVSNNAGASAIFKLFTARPQLWEKRLQRPPDNVVVAAAAATAVSKEPPPRADYVDDNKRRRV